MNLGGCVVPTLVAVYEMLQNSWGLPNLPLSDRGGGGHQYGNPMPALVPPLVAAPTSLLLGPAGALSVVFVVGVFGPLLGAVISHIRGIPRIATDIASNKGAGTFDGIVLSEILAAYLA